VLKYNKMSQRKKAFTLIELIIVVVIIGILALVAIPRYFANVAKAQKTQVYANLNAILRVSKEYYAANGAWPAYGVFPIIVTIDGEAVSQISNPSNSQWIYTSACQGANSDIWAYKQPGNSCYYGIYCGNGATYQSCTP